MATGKKQRSYSIDFRMKIFQEIDAWNLSMTDICLKKCDFPSFTLSTFLKNRDKIEGENSSGSRKRIRETVYSDIDEVLYSWFLMARQSAIPIGGSLMKEKQRNLPMILGTVNLEPQQVGSSDSKVVKGSFQKWFVVSQLQLTLLLLPIGNRSLVASWKATLRTAFTTWMKPALL